MHKIRVHNAYKMTLATLTLSVTPEQKAFIDEQKINISKFFREIIQPEIIRLRRIKEEEYRQAQINQLNAERFFQREAADAFYQQNRRPYR